MLGPKLASPPLGSLSLLFLKPSSPMDKYGILDHSPQRQAAQDHQSCGEDTKNYGQTPCRPLIIFGVHWILKPRTVNP